MVYLLNKKLMINIRKLIKESLRENLNNITEGAQHKTTKAQLFRMMFKIAKAYEMFGPHSNKPSHVRKYFDNPESGQGVYRVVIKKNGDIQPGINRASAEDIKKTGRLGLIHQSDTDMIFNIIAARGINHGGNEEDRTSVAITQDVLTSSDQDILFNLEKSEFYKDLQNKFTYKIIKDDDLNKKVKYKYYESEVEKEEANGNKVKIGSPFSDAIIKTLISYGEIIIDWMIKDQDDYDAYISNNDAKSTDAYKQMAADPERMTHKLRQDFRTAYKQKTGKEPSEQEIQDFLQSGEENVEQYLDRNDIKKGERNLISLRNKPDFDINSLNRRDQGRYRTYQDLVRKQERGEVLTNDEKRDFRTLSAKFEKLKKGL